MKLVELLKNIDVINILGDNQVEINGIACDSRRVEQGNVFVAQTGTAVDGHTFIAQCVEKGACAIVLENTDYMPQTAQEGVTYILVKNSDEALGKMAHKWYGEPTKHLKLVGVTGTNGKTSVTLLLKQLLEKTVGAKVGLIGTMENRIGDAVIPTERTTPESFELQGLFRKMKDAGCTHVVMEVSSHAVTLERIGGVRFDIAAFTNLTEDHLDFHKTMDAYCDAKAELFRRCNKGVLNGDDEYYNRIRSAATCKILTTSVKSSAQLYAQNVALHADGISFTAVSGDVKQTVSLPIPGRFTVYNALSVLGIGLQLGISLKDAADALKTAKGVRGRVEVVPTPGKPYTVLVDYAHTPDGLENVLRSVRDFCKGRLIAVFGCGGDRDPVKRPIMGRIGVELSDIAVITSDNPRKENPFVIIKDILL